MSGSEEKTEQPTAKRLADARKRGQVAKSADFNTALVIGAIALLLMTYGGAFYQYMSRLTIELLSHQLKDSTPMTQDGFLSLMHQLAMHMVIVVAPFMFGAMILGVAGNVFQVRFMFTLDPLKPNLGKLNPMAGFKRLLSQKSIIELIKGIFKMAIVGIASYSIINNEQPHLLSMSQMGFSSAWVYIFQIVLKITSTCAIALLGLGVADWWYQHYQLMKQLKMSKQEVKDEMKNVEGNPQIKQKIRQAGQAIIRKRMMAAIPTADVIVTNPTHFAVAIQYDPDLAPAPRVVAKGADAMAFRIREVAKEHGVPIIENKPLARGLYAQVEVDSMIPPELFITVAEVLAVVYKKNKGRRKLKKSITGGM